MSDQTPHQPSGPAAPYRPASYVPVTPGWAGTLLADRYEIVDLVSRSGSWSVWRATDTTLGRDVAVRMLPLNDPHTAHIRAAARRAALVEDRRLIGILDIAESHDALSQQEGGGTLLIITEWAQGRTLADLLAEREPLNPSLAAYIAHETAVILDAAHAAGIAHGRLHPSDILIGPELSMPTIRVRGIGVTAMLDPDPASGPVDTADAARTLPLDIAGVGRILYAGLTARWPGGRVDALREAPTDARGIMAPSKVAADVPGRYDRIVARAVPGIEGAGRSQPFTRMAELIEALTAPPSTHSIVVAPQRKIRRIAMTVGLLAAIFAAGGFVAAAGWALVTGGPSPWGTTTSNQLGILTAPVIAAPKTAPVAAPTDIFQILRASTYDPLGDGTENDDQVELAFDGDLATSWTTEQYAATKFGVQKIDMQSFGYPGVTANADTTLSQSTKSGVGIVFDLGSEHAVRGVDLSLIGFGTGLKILVSSDKTLDLADWELLTTADAAGADLHARILNPVTGRYLMVWFTYLPADGSGSVQGGIKNIVISG